MADQEQYYGNGEEYNQESMEVSNGNGSSINASKNDDDDSSASRKMFVGGLSRETTDKDMREYFGKFGEVSDVNLKSDPTTGRSRGFGFVLFADASSVTKVLEEKAHLLHGRNIDPKRAKARGGREPILKVFVGGLDPSVPKEDIEEHFAQYGKVTDIDLPYDKMKQQRRAFAFVTFESEGIVDECCKSAKQTLGSKQVDVKKATPKNDGFGGGFGGRGARGGGFGGRGRGRGRGGYDQWGNGGGGYGGYGGGYGSGYDYSQGYGGGYGSGYDYSQGYGGGYDYSQGYGGGYDYSGYGGQSYGSGGYGAGGQQGGYGKSKTGGRGGTGGSYHPYSR